MMGFHPQRVDRYARGERKRSRRDAHGMTNLCSQLWGNEVDFRTVQTGFGFNPRPGRRAENRLFRRPPHRRAGALALHTMPNSPPYRSC